jgi:outer membrane protein assembly factor BamB
MLGLLAATAGGDEPPRYRAKVLQRYHAAQAHQAVAVDDTSFFAVTNRSIARYQKGTGKRLAQWTAEADSPVRHLNSATVHAGRLYCANSNWPQTPLHNTIEIFDAATLQHLERKEFTETDGAINWVEHHDGAWWIVLAFYGQSEVRRTRLVRYDDRWKETGRWRFPETVIQRFLPNSNSGGSFGPDGQLWVTGHDHAELYVLAVPGDLNDSGQTGTLNHTTTVAAPIAGQGVAWDRQDRGVLFGIVRWKREVVAMRITSAADNE